MNAETRERLRQAVSDRRRELVKAPPNPESLAKSARRRSGLAVVTVHGRGGYNCGCKCDVCLAGNSAYNAEWARAKRAAS